MTATDEDDAIITVGRAFPRLVAFEPLEGFDAVIHWEKGGRSAEREVVDLGPAIRRFRTYAALRSDPALFRTGRVQEHGGGLTWQDGAIDMGVPLIEAQADETMSSETFAAFMARHGFTLDRVAAELGVSRRTAATYRKQARLPRTVALACRYIDLTQGGNGAAVMGALTTPRDAPRRSAR